MKIKKYIEEIKTKDGNVKYKANVKIQTKPFLFIFPNYKTYMLIEECFSKAVHLKKYGDESVFDTQIHALESLDRAIEEFIKKNNSKTIVRKTKKLIV